MKLTTTQTLIPLFEQCNGNNADLTASGANVRFINVAISDRSSVSGWTIRQPADEEFLDATLSGMVLTMTDAGSGAKLRKGETIKVYDSTPTYLGSLNVAAIDGEEISVSYGGGVEIVGTIASVKIEADPLLIENSPREFVSRRMKNIIVKTDSECELSIVTLEVFGTEQ